VNPSMPDILFITGKTFVAAVETSKFPVGISSFSFDEKVKNPKIVLSSKSLILSYSTDDSEESEQIISESNLINL